MTSVEPPAPGLKALWKARPAIYSRWAWLLMMALDPLPWPWGEAVFAKLFVAKALVGPSRLRSTLAWAGAQSVAGLGRWRLALSACAHHGRFVARQMLLGLRTPEDLRRRVVLLGEEHLNAVSKGAILLGFHLGPPGAAVALRSAGHRVIWMGGMRTSRSWSSEAWRPVRELVDDLSTSAEPTVVGGTLYRARQLLLDGGLIYITADGVKGREAFRVELPGGAARIRSGWLVLRRQCGVPVLPVLTHLDGLTQVIVIHPPLPPQDPDPALDLTACRDVLAALLEAYVRRFPVQCYGLTFPRGMATPPPGPA